MGAIRNAAKLATGFAVGAGGTYSLALGMGMLGNNQDQKTTENLMVRPKLPTRKEIIDELRSKEFDILVVGGGATGMFSNLFSFPRDGTAGLLWTYRTQAAISACL